MDLKYKESFVLRSCNCDLTGRLKPSELLTFMQEVAGTHAAMLGAGREELLKDGIVWIVSRVKIVMDCYPRIFDKLTVETFPKKVDGPFFPRYFRFLDDDGKEYGRASTAWLIFDINARRVLRPRSLKNMYETDESLPEPVALPGRITIPDDMRERETRRVRYSEADVNGHMNNARYADYVCDLFPTQWWKENHAAEFEINYTREAMPGAAITLSLSEAGGECRILGDDGQGGEYFAARVKFAPDEK